MNIIYLIGLVAVLLSIVAARMISESALRKLSHAEVMNLEGAFDGYKKFSLILLAPLAFVVWVLFSGNYDYYLVSVIIFFIFLITYFIFAYFIARKKISSLGIDKNYLKKLFLSFSIRFIGIAIFCGIIIYSNLSEK
jgi:Ca2+/Na+ antiporter